MIKLKFFFLLFILSQTANAQDEYKYCKTIESVQSAIANLHYEPIDLKENERKEIVSLYFNLIDDENFYLTQEDLSELQNTAAQKGLCESFQQSLVKFKKGITRYDSIATEFYKKPIVLVKGESLLTNSSKNDHLRANQKNYSKHIELSLKHDYLIAIYDKIQSDSTLEKKITAILDNDIRKKLAQNEHKFASRKLENNTQLEKQLLSDFLNALALRFDPHSGYFSVDAKADYEEELSSERLVYGIQFIENENFDIEVTGITPGSSAWNSNLIEKGDILLEIIDHKGTKHELNNKGMAYLSQVLGQVDTKEASFNFKHKNGGISLVKLVKTKIENTDNSFTGYILEDKQQKLAYIALPSFYTDFEGDVQLGCANDVAKEILLLKKDSIQGLILDLRNNGGGSLKEAIELSGLFIDEGPMSIYQRKNEKPSLLKDMNRGTVYNGPLIILVNSMSASASEFFAGCMQDYKRAIIVGDNTYGKGTAQAIYPVSYLPENQDFVKVTGAKFYHVSSRSNQEIGIKPDILLEDIYSNLDYYLEANELYHLKNDSTSKKIVYNAKSLKHLEELNTNSKTRTSKSLAYLELKDKAKLLAQHVQEDRKIPLDFDTYLTYSEKNKAFWDEVYSTKNNGEAVFTIKNHSFANRLLGLNAEEQKFNEKIKENIKKDILLNESFLIFKDLLAFPQ